MSDERLNKMNGWRPIATAPDDDEPVLISDGHMVCSANKYFLGKNKFIWEPYGYYGLECEPDFNDPTHWQPLPDAPK